MAFLGASTTQDQALLARPPHNALATVHARTAHANALVVTPHVVRPPSKIASSTWMMTLLTAAAAVTNVHPELESCRALAPAASAKSSATQATFCASMGVIRPTLAPRSGRTRLTVIDSLSVPSHASLVELQVLIDYFVDNINVNNTGAVMVC